MIIEKILKWIVERRIAREQYIEAMKTAIEETRRIDEIRKCNAGRWKKRLEGKGKYQQGIKDYNVERWKEGSKRKGKFWNT